MVLRIFGALGFTFIAFPKKYESRPTAFFLRFAMGRFADGTFLGMVQSYFQGLSRPLYPHDHLCPLFDLRVADGKGTEETAVKLLLSHDPSHWEAQVLNTDVDVTFSGHTHGFQFGIEVGNFKWSPAQYAYKQWAGLYTNNNQQLYVNRGFGYLGFPGRIGMPPEITVFELSRA